MKNPTVMSCDLISYRLVQQSLCYDLLGLAMRNTFNTHTHTDTFITGLSKFKEKICLWWDLYQKYHLSGLNGLFIALLSFCNSEAFYLIDSPLKYFNSRIWLDYPIISMAWPFLLWKLCCKCLLVSKEFKIKYFSIPIVIPLQLIQCLWTVRCCLVFAQQHLT